MTEADERMLEEAREFLAMLRNAYHEVWRRRYSGDPDISRKAVLLMFDDCQFYRREIARIFIKRMDEGLEPLEGQGDLLFMDADYRSLLSAVMGKRPKYVPPRVVA